MQRLPPAAVLIVDDMPANLLALKTLLRPLGHEIVTAQSGVEAIELASQREFAVMLLDVMMPMLDGIGTLERLRTLPHANNTPVIFLTAYQPERTLLERAYALGALDFVEKPVAVEVLRAKVSSFVALYQQGLEIRRQADELRAKDRHLGVLAHDLRTPLSVIVSSLDRLRITSEDEKVKQVGERISRAARRMERLVEDLLEFARASAGQFVPKRERIDLVPLCEEILEDVSAIFPVVKFTRELPAQLIGLCDPARVEQAVTNLLVNGAKHGSGWVSLRLTDSAGRAELTVANGGDVISAQRLPHLFEPFVRGDVSNDGLGLGLYIAREIARVHGGELHAESDPSSTRFVMRLPLAA
jgi:two-component system, sensor histidine kinase and response regulator